MTSKNIMKHVISQKLLLAPSFAVFYLVKSYFLQGKRLRMTKEKKRTQRFTTQLIINQSITFVCYITAKTTHITQVNTTSAYGERL